MQVHGRFALCFKHGPKVLRNLLTQPGRVDDQTFNTAPLEALHGPLHQGLATHGQQRFWHDIREGPHALATTCGQEQAGS